MLEALALAAAAFWIGLAALCLARVRAVPDLPVDAAPAETPRRLTVVVAARDEQDTIADTVTRMLGQHGVETRVVAVDDRSSDATGSILDRLAAADPRLDVIHVTDLPDGWLGKNHACALGAAHAADADDPPDWLLFADADTCLQPTATARALGHATAEATDHLCLLPELLEITPLGRGLIGALFLGFCLQGAPVNRDRPRAYIGIGAFNLVRRATYEAIGGHAALRHEVLEDLCLGRSIRQAGHRSRVAFGVDAVAVRWIAGVRSFFTLCEKNYFATVDYSVPRALAFSLGAWLAWLIPLLSVLPTRPFGALGPLAALGLASLAIPGAIIAHRYRWGAHYGLLVPLCVPLAPAGLLWSMFQNLRHGIRWRGTTYRLDDTKHQGKPL